MDFLYTFLNFLQPGILWPELAPYRPLLVISAIGAIVGFFRNSIYPRSEAFLHPAFLYMVIFLMVQVLSLYYGGVDSMLVEIDFWSTYMLFVTISILLINDARSLERYVWGMIIGSMVVVFYGIYAVYASLPAAVGGRAGAFGMYENHNDYSFIIIMVLPFIYMYWKSQASTSIRLLLMLFLLACVFGIFLSLSRGGMLALVVEVGLIVIIAMDKKKRFRYLLMLSILGVAAISYQWAAREANQGDIYTVEDSEYSREELWKAGKNMVKEHPWLGVGSRRFGEFSQEYGEISHDNINKNAHNTYIEVIADSGLIGFVPFVLMFLSLIRELKSSATHFAQEPLGPILKATLISLYAIMFRALFDAKAHDWSLYVLCVIGISCVILRRHIATVEHEKNAVTIPEEVADA